MSDKLVQDFFNQFSQEVKVVNLMAKFDRTPVTNNGIQVFYCCPFHSDSSPSFSVNLERNVFRCFGCGREGGPYNLIKEWLMFESHPCSPSAITAFAETNLRFPVRQRHVAPEIGKRRKFLAQINPSLNTKQTHDKAFVINQIMLGLSDRPENLAIWEGLLK